jgi:excisionase family DNA binding protein
MAIDRLLTLTEVLQLLNITRSTLYRWIEQGEYPPPFHIGNKGTKSRWSELEHQAYIEKKRNAPRETSGKLKLVHNGNNAPA